MQPGSFYAVVGRSPIVGLGWLASRSSKSAKLLAESLEACITSPSRSSAPLRSSLEDRISPLHPQASLTKVQKYILNGGGVVLRQGVYQLATECYRIHPYIYTTKNIICVFYGYLSNLDDLVLRSSAKLDPSLLEAVSYPSDAACMLERNRDVGTLSANVVLQAYLDCGEDNELVVLSELQGHYAFVIYDSNRRQAFAARDCSGDEKLYHYQNPDNGSIAFTNDPSELPDAVRGEDWAELPPGHFISGKHPKVQQFALTLEQLESLSAEMDSGIFGGCGGSDTKSRASMDSQFFDMDG